MRKFESSQKDESRALSADSSKVCEYLELLSVVELQPHISSRLYIRLKGTCSPAGRALLK